MHGIDVCATPSSLTFPPAPTEARKAVRDPAGILARCLDLTLGAELRKGGWSLAAMSLERLLLYTEDDDKEGHFEVGRWSGSDRIGSAPAPGLAVRCVSIELTCCGCWGW